MPSLIHPTVSTIKELQKRVGFGLELGYVNRNVIVVGDEGGRWAQVHEYCSARPPGGLAPTASFPLGFDLGFEFGFCSSAHLCGHPHHASAGEPIQHNVSGL